MRISKIHFGPGEWHFMIVWRAGFVHKHPPQLMRFLMLNWRDPRNPKPGGAEQVSRAYLGALAERGHGEWLDQQARRRFPSWL